MAAVPHRRSLPGQTQAGGTKLMQKFVSSCLSTPFLYEEAPPQPGWGFFSIQYLGCGGQGQSKAVHPGLYRGAGRTAAEPLAVHPSGGAGEGVEVRGAGADPAAAGSAEGNDGLAAEIIALQEGADDFRSLPPPDGIAQENHIVLLHVIHTAGDSGTGAGIILLIIGAAVRVVVQIGGGIGLLRRDFIEVGVQNGVQVVGNALRIVGSGEVGDQNLGPGGGCVRRFGNRRSFAAGGAVHILIQSGGNLHTGGGCGGVKTAILPAC